MNCSLQGIVFVCGDWEADGPPISNGTPSSRKIEGSDMVPCSVVISVKNHCDIRVDQANVPRPGSFGEGWRTTCHDNEDAGNGS